MTDAEVAGGETGHVGTKGDGVGAKADGYGGEVLDNAHDGANEDEEARFVPALYGATEQMTGVGSYQSILSFLLQGTGA